MNLFKRTALAAALSLAVLNPAAAQWQTPNRSVPVGRGAGVTGFGSAAPGAAGNVLTSNGPAADPSFQPVTTGIVSVINAACTLAPSACIALFGHANALWYGVKCDGATDDTAAMISAISLSTAAGATLLLPPGGNCMVTALGVMPSRSHIRGQGYYQSVLWETSPTATMFTISNPDFTIDNLSVQTIVARAPTAVTFDMSQPGNAYFRNLTISGHGILFKTEPSGSTAVQFTIDSVLIGSTVLNGVDFDLGQCFICTVSNTNAFHDHNARPFAEFVLRNVPGQLQLFNVNLDQATYGMYVNPGAGQVVTLVKADLAYLDSNPGGALLCAPTGTGIIQRMAFSNGWMTGGGGPAVECAGGGSTQVDQLSFDNIEFVGGSSGNTIVITSATSVAVTNSRFGPIGASSADISLVNVTGCNVTGNMLFGFQGVNLSGTTSYCDVHDNMNTYVTTPVVSSATGANNRITNP